jgi:hypothetical protein
MTRRSLFLLLLITALLASCAPSAPAEPTVDINTMIAANAQTMAVAILQTQAALVPTATNTALPTATSLPTATALVLPSPTTFIQQPVLVVPTATGPTPTPLASSLASGCNNLGLIYGWTEPDSPLNPGQDFTQYWKVENTGTCDWMFVYAIVFASGTKLGEATSVRLDNKIPPDKWTTLAVNLHAPNKSGTYKASWRMSDGGGKTFGAVLPISITVGGPTKTPVPPTSTPDLPGTAAAAQKTADAAVATASKQALCLTSPQAPPDPPCP